MAVIELESIAAKAMRVMSILGMLLEFLGNAQCDRQEKSRRSGTGERAHSSCG